MRILTIILLFISLSAGAQNFDVLPTIDTVLSTDKLLIRPLNTTSPALRRITMEQVKRFVNRGLSGVTGATGPTGAQGVTGPTGAQGITGPTGSGGSGSGWSLTGNSGTTAGTNFIGTTDSVDFVVKTKNSEALRVYTNKAILNAINSTTQFFTYRPFPFQPTRIGFGYTYIKAGFDSLSVLFVDETGLIYAVGNAATGYTSSFKCDKDEINTSMVNGNHVFGYECRRSVPHVEQYISYTTGNYNIAEATLKRNGISIMADGESRHQKNQLWVDTTGISYKYNDTLKFKLDSAGIMIKTGNPAAGKSLICDSIGNATWGNQILTGNATLDFGTIAPNSHETLTVTLTGAALGDVVSLGIPNSSTDDHGAFMAWVSATDTVSVKCFNFDGVGFNPASGVFKVKIFK